MSRYGLLSLFQFAVLLCLVIIGGTTYYALSQEAMNVAVAEDSSLTGGTLALPAEFQRGKQVWNANGCGACHVKSMTQDATGPALAGVTGRWAGEPQEHLYAWIRNSPKLAASGTSERAAEMIDWSGRAMTLYPSLSDGEIEALLIYIEANS